LFLFYISGKKREIPVLGDDVEILTAFLKGAKKYSDGVVENPIEAGFPRLEELLGTPR